MKKIVKKIFVSFFSMAMFLSMSMGVDFLINAKAEGRENMGIATVVATDTWTKGAWQGNYGTNGYVVFANIPMNAYGKNYVQQSGFYSTFYTNYIGDDGKGANDNGKGYSDTALIYGDNSGGRRDAAEQKYMHVYGDSRDATNNYYLDEDAPISRWNYTTVSWYGNGSTTDLPNGLYAPNTQNPMDFTANLDVSGGTVRNDTSLLFTLKEDTLTYVTVYVYDQNKKADTSNAMEIFVYPTAKNASNRNATAGISGAADLDAFYGATPIAKTTITNDGTYVTFALQGAGDYQIVVADDNSDYTQKGATRPTIAGFFFDEKLMRSAEVVNVDSATTASEWEGTYGNDGFIVFAGGDDSAWTTRVAYYSDMYGNDGKSLTTAVSQTNRNNNGIIDYTKPTASDSATNNYGLSDTAPITRWAHNTISWWSNSSNSENLTLQIPGSTEHTGGAFGPNGGTVHNDSSVRFTLKENLKTYVTVFVNSVWVAAGTQTGLDVSVYPTNQEKFNNVTNTSNGKGEIDLDKHYKATPLAKVSGFTNASYITFALEGKGDYQIVVSCPNNNEANTATQKGNIQGIFFDYVEYNTVTYHLDGGENSMENPVKFPIDETIILQPAQKDGYRFIG